jgi:hypothetical protein
MPSDLQLNANRENAQHSTGPRTPEGKSRTRLNAFRHGLTGQILIFTPDEQAAFDAHCAGIRDSYKPIGALETELAHSIAEDRWRLRRARAIENAIFALSLDAAEPDAPELSESAIAFSTARAFIQNSKALDLLSIYETRLQRNIERNIRQIEHVQKQREDYREKVIAEEFALVKLDDVCDLRAYFPADNLNHSAHRFGFDFSEDELRGIFKRRNRLEQAGMLRDRAWDPNRLTSNWPQNDGCKN